MIIKKFWLILLILSVIILISLYQQAQFSNNTSAYPINNIKNRSNLTYSSIDQFSAQQLGEFVQAKLKFGIATVNRGNEIMQSIFDQFPTANQSNYDENQVFQTDPIFITGISSNHFKEALNMLKSFRETLGKHGYKMVVYDVGLK